VVFPVDIAGEVLGGPADLEQHLLEVAPFGGVHGHGVVVDALAEHRRDLLRAADLFENRAVGADQHQGVHRMLLQSEPAVAVHRLGDVDQQGMRHRVPAPAQERVDDLLGVVARSTGVPQSQRCQPVRVHVLG
jgi:hypothetical protein